LHAFTFCFIGRASKISFLQPSRKKAKTTRKSAEEEDLYDHADDNSDEDDDDQEDEPEDGFAEMMAEKKSEPGGTRFAQKMGVLLQQNSDFIKTRQVFHNKYYAVFFVSCVENGFNPDMLIKTLSTAWKAIGKRAFRFMFYLNIVLKNRVTGQFRFYHSQTNSPMFKRPALLFVSPRSIPPLHKLFSTFDFEGLHHRPYESSDWQFLMIAAVELRVWIIHQ